MTTAPESNAWRLLWFVLDNWESITAIAAALFTFIKMARKLKTVQAALLLMAQAGELMRSKEFKSLVTQLRLAHGTPKEVSKVVREAAQTADPKKTNPVVSVPMQILDALPFTGPRVLPMPPVDPVFVEPTEKHHL